MSIQVLDQETINKIAAGEVIERPSSVVKELVENAIDAGATAVTIEIKDGGISFIRITDNGSGISKDDIPMAFLRHSTSKIKSIEDLMNVSSLGFRGEALSSIAAVSQVELITKTADDFTGSRYVIEGGNEISLEEVGAPDGTTFIVRNLFYNTPVRRKFLKTAATEAGYVNALIEHLSLSHPDISFRFINNNQNKLHTSGNMNLKDIIYGVYGRDITSNLMEISGKTQDVEITGFIGKPVICRGNRGYENYYINGRYIKSSIITKAIEEAYKGYIMPHNYPFTAIHFKINPSIMDVNVHPTKMELRFSKNEFVYRFVLETVKECLANRELAARVKLPDPVKQQQSTKSPENIKQTEKSYVQENTDSKPYQAPRIEPPRESFYNSTESSVKQKAVNENQTAGFIKNTTDYTKMPPTRLPEPFEIKRSDEMIKEDKKIYEAEKKQEAEQLSMFDTPLMSGKAKADYRIIGQLFETYWLIEYEDKFYMMDQHAAHEKILYERFMNHLKVKDMDTQMIMPPVIIELNMQQEDAYKRNKQAFSRLGFEIEEFGGNAYKVNGLPAGLPNINLKQMLIDMIDGLTDDNSTDLDIITERVATMSCKAAVKGNNKLSFEEAKELIEELMQAENPYNCPHGRPTLIVMSKYEVERKFKRIL
ncbi:DNA mismatch repair endonuclease MutL [Lachnospira hominis (ex Hitch et al. 2024)]|jgi:DNA mismatch repair protein MutL|uniref:DNA mismatch repair protein MutL n=1 Tax=Lachnospira intestinalis TaxID=3133158 RepID=A0ABV1GMN8_9FIRM